MWISSLIIGLTFLTVIGLIISEKMNRAVASLMGGLICFFVLIFVEGLNFDQIVGFLMGTPDDDYGNLRSILLILGMLIIVEISVEGGVFQFLAFKMIQLTKGRPVPLLVTFCILSMFIAAVLNNLLSVLILIPLTITICRILNVNATPYILTEAIVVNQGATIFVISSIPNILIANHIGITFSEYFVKIGLITIVIFIFTIFLWLIFIPKKLTPPTAGIDILLEFNVWNFVPNRKLMIKSAIVLLSVMLGFIVLPSIPSDTIAMTGAIILIVISGLEMETFIKRVDFELILYIFGIFLVTGALDHIGIIDTIGNWLNGISPTDVYWKFVMILWSSAFLSASVDNIPITQVLIPVTDIMTQGYSYAESHFIFYGLIFGVNWGDNLSPMGDNILVMNVAEKNKSPIKMKDFFILGFFTTIYQLYILTILFGFAYYPLASIIMIIVGVSIGLSIGLLRRKKKNNNDLSPIS